MIARGFKSVIWVATVGGAALCCYMVSLRVATERADLARVETQIVAAKRDIRSLKTELGTRGRLTQLEAWNSDVLALSAPTSAQFVNDRATLARLERHDVTVEERSGDVRLASAEAPAASPAAAAVAEKPEPAPKLVPAIAPPAAPPPPSLVRRASYTPTPIVEQARAKAPPAPPAAVAAPRPVTPDRQAAAKPAKAKAAAIASVETPPKPAKAKPVAASAQPPAKARLTATASAQPPAKPVAARPAKPAVAPARIIAEARHAAPARTAAADPKRPASRGATARTPKALGSDGN
ncbi:MAG TPA: hypothetical protein VGD66_05125 [Allosphingosinicella sp.]|jgi:hypothetical protein